MTLLYSLFFVWLLLRCIDCLCVAPCGACSGTTPGEFEITFAGIADQSCGECELLNDTYILTQTEFNPCFFRYDLPASICAASAPGDFVRVDFDLDSTTFDPIVEIEAFNASLSSLWRRTNGAAYDCGFSSTDFPFFSEGSTACAFASSTCTVTAL